VTSTPNLSLEQPLVVAEQLSRILSESTNPATTEDTTQQSILQASEPMEQQQTSRPMHEADNISAILVTTSDAGLSAPSFNQSSVVAEVNIPASGGQSEQQASTNTVPTENPPVTEQQPSSSGTTDPASLEDFRAILGDIGIVI
jgi:hypothetical protein